MMAVSSSALTSTFGSVVEVTTLHPASIGATHAKAQPNADIFAVNFLITYLLSRFAFNIVQYPRTQKNTSVHQINTKKHHTRPFSGIEGLVFPFVGIFFYHFYDVLRLFPP